jgi:hypothetical protein
LKKIQSAAHFSMSAGREHRDGNYYEIPEHLKISFIEICNKGKDQIGIRWPMAPIFIYESEADEPNKELAKRIPRTTPQAG